MRIGRFRYIAALTKASTDDGTAYSVTGLHAEIRAGRLRSDCHVVLDEGYTCTDQELTPWPITGNTHFGCLYSLTAAGRPLTAAKGRYDNLLQ